MLQDKSDPNKYVFYEVYVDDGEAVTFHRAQPHFKAWSDFKAKYGIVSQTVVKADAVDWTAAEASIQQHQPAPAAVPPHAIVVSVEIKPETTAEFRKAMKIGHHYRTLLSPWPAAFTKNFGQSYLGCIDADCSP